MHLESQATDAFRNIRSGWRVQACRASSHFKDALATTQLRKLRARSSSTGSCQVSGRSCEATRAAHATWKAGSARIRLLRGRTNHIASSQGSNLCLTDPGTLQNQEDNDHPRHEPLHPDFSCI